MNVLSFAARSQDLKDPLHCSELFSWTLTHPTKAFSKIEPIFYSREDLLGYIDARTEEDYRMCVTRLAELKIANEWQAWVNVHSDTPIYESKLDNMLMKALYRLVLNRDSGKCARCNSQFHLTIHHIIPKQRNYLRKAPPFGRSVPTNLITLCRDCHASLNPFFSVSSYN